MSDFCKYFGMITAIAVLLASPAALAQVTIPATPCLPGLPCDVPLTPNNPTNPNDGPKIGPNKSKSSSDACDADFMNQIHARAFLEAQREEIINQVTIRKPDSVLEYTCFDQAVRDTAKYAGPIFSESERWKDIRVPLSRSRTGITIGTISSIPGLGDLLRTGLDALGLDPVELLQQLGLDIDNILRDSLDLLTDEFLDALKEKGVDIEKIGDVLDNLSNTDFSVLLDELGDEALTEILARAPDALSEGLKVLTDTEIQNTILSTLPLDKRIELAKELGTTLDRLPEALKDASARELEDALKDANIPTEEITEAIAQAEEVREKVTEAIAEAEALRDDIVKGIEELAKEGEEILKDVLDATIDTLSDGIDGLLKELGVNKEELLKTLQELFPDELADLLGNIAPKALQDLLSLIFGDLGSVGGILGGLASGDESVPVSVSLGSDHMDGVLDQLIMVSLNEYLDKNFAHDFLGGTAGENNSIASTVSGAGTSCTFMDDLFFVAKCNAIGLDDRFLTFEELAGVNLRLKPTACPAGNNPIAQKTIDIAFNKDRSFASLDLVKTYVDYTDPDACEPPIPTGLIVTQNQFKTDLAGNQNLVKQNIFPDFVCLNPGCFFDGGSSCKKEP